jgi:ABC-type uncharacterized transport system permease subunit
VRAPLPLLSAIGFLVAAGALLSRWAPWGALGAAVLVAIAVLLLRDRDGQIASYVADDALELVNSLAAAAREKAASK